MVEEGDIIEIDIPACKLELKVSDEEIAKRRADFTPKMRPGEGYLKRYRAMVASSSEGAVFKK